MAEKILWERLRRNALGFKFFRQYSVSGYVLDFYCPERKVGIELEGLIHSTQKQIVYDKYRFRYLESFGIEFIKVSNKEIYEEIGKVIESIKLVLGSPS